MRCLKNRSDQFSRPSRWFLSQVVSSELMALGTVQMTSHPGCSHIWVPRNGWLLAAVIEPDGSYEILRKT
eukprot:7796372-Ditylum_brightwellii.AAC.1